MRIALYSHLFPPHLGGSGVHAKLLAEGFAVLGHAVTVITSTSSGAEETTSPFQLVRRPKLRQLCAMLAQSDLVLEVGPCMTAGFLARALFKPLVVAHPMFPATGMRGLATRVLCTGVPNIAPSAAVGRALPISSTVIPNPHDDSVFKKWTAINDRKRDLVFVGRLIKEKGLQNVLLALNHLREKEILLSLMVVGSGPDAEWYKEESKKLGLNNQVTFVGAVSPAQIAEIYNVHKIAVVPSTWEEPFGIVALEGIACGCAVVGSISGGLPEAIGPCGLTYPKMSVGDLAARLEQLVLEPRLLEALQKYAEQHLARHTRTAVAAKYLRFMSDCFPNLAFAGGRSTNTADSLGLVEATHG